MQYMNERPSDASGEAAFSRVVFDHAAARPDAPFLCWQSQLRFSYRDLCTMVSELCRQFETYKVKPGGTVALVGNRHWLFHPLLMACAAYGAVLVPIDSDRPVEELGRILLSACPRLVISENLSYLPNPNGGQSFLSTAALADKLVAALTTRPRADTDTTVLTRAERGSVVLMPYSNGSTGRLNGVMITHDNLVAGAQALAQLHGITSNDVIAAMPPYHHILSSMLGAVLPLYVGASVVLSERFTSSIKVAHVTGVYGSAVEALNEQFNAENALAYWNDVDSTNATICILNPMIMTTLLEAVPAEPPPPPRALRFALCGGGVLTKELWRRFEDHFGVVVHQGYGLTEATGWVTCTSAQRGNRDSVGAPLGCEVRVHTIPNLNTDEFSYDRRHKWRPEHSLNPRQGPLGEIQIKGANVMGGYFKNPRGTHEVITNDGFLRTGDIGFIDPQGMLHFVGRIKETIVRNGRTVYPRDIDRTAELNELVGECKTVGIPDVNANQKVVTVCTPKNGDPTTFPSREIHSWLKQQLPLEAIPDSVFALASLPRSSSGRVSTATLRGIVTGRVTESIIENLAKPKYSKSPPSDLDAVKSIVDKTIVSGRPLRFVCYWGAGHRNSAGEVDEDALRRLFAYLRSLEVIPGLKSNLTVILHDIHGAVNCVDRAISEPYYAEIEPRAQSHGFATVRMSQLWAEAGLSLDEAMARAKSDAFIEDFKHVPIRDLLVSQAVKYGRNKAIAPEIQARNYLASCLHEGKMMATKFQDHVFLSYTMPDMDLCLPPMPKCYLYSSRKWSSSRPWFSD